MNMKNVVGVVQRIIGVALLTSALSATVYATSFTGTITETITSTEDSRFHVGQTVVGSYAYESAIVDGIFGTVFYNSLATPLSSSFVYLFLDTSWPDGGWLDFSHSGLGLFSSRGLTVNGGHVSGFELQGQTGFLDYGFFGSNFSVHAPSGAHFDETLITRGTLSFSDPVSVAEPSSLILLGLSLAGVIAVNFIRGRHSLKSQIPS